MEIVNFFEKLAGKWFSQRTVHDLANQVSRAGQSDLQVDWVEPEHPDIAQLCRQAQTQSNDALGGLRIAQSSLMDGDTKRQESITFIVLLNSDHANQGKLLRQANDVTQPPISGQYALEADVLTLITESDKFRAQERLWFANPNLRMRTNLLETSDGIRLTSFCSEIRMGMNRPSPSRGRMS